MSDHYCNCGTGEGCSIHDKDAISLWGPMTDNPTLLKILRQIREEPTMEMEWEEAYKVTRIRLMATIDSLELCIKTIDRFGGDVRGFRKQIDDKITTKLTAALKLLQPKLPQKPEQDADDPVLKLAKELAADDSMWNTQECVELNLLEFARRVAALDFARNQERL